jgi:hypothetical protein
MRQSPKHSPPPGRPGGCSPQGVALSEWPTTPASCGPSPTVLFTLQRWPYTEVGRVGSGTSRCATIKIGFVQRLESPLPCDSGPSCADSERYESAASTMTRTSSVSGHHGSPQLPRRVCLPCTTEFESPAGDPVRRDADNFAAHELDGGLDVRKGHGGAAYFDSPHRPGSTDTMSSMTRAT